MDYSISRYLNIMKLIQEDTANKRDIKNTAEDIERIKQGLYRINIK